jgi:hypothetical protein
MLRPIFFKQLFHTGSAFLAMALLCPAQTQKPVKKSSHKAAPKTAASKTVPQHSRPRSQASSRSGHVVLASAHKKTKSRKRKRAANWRTRGQQRIDPQRTRDIQEALIREHYLDGTPSGVWDDKSEKAMRRFQADNGWQSKMTPDSRALIKLGLGPDHAHLLNPDSAMTADPAPAAPHASRPISPAPPPSAPAATAPSENIPAQKTDSGQSVDPAKN